jgi:hypothetical protein
LQKAPGCKRELIQTFFGKIPEEIMFNWQFGVLIGENVLNFTLLFVKLLFPKKDPDYFGLNPIDYLFKKLKLKNI